MQYPLISVVVEYQSNQHAVLQNFIESNLDENGNFVCPPYAELAFVVEDAGGRTPYTAVVFNDGLDDCTADIDVHSNETQDIQGRTKIGKPVCDETWAIEMLRLGDRFERLGIGIYSYKRLRLAP